MLAEALVVALAVALPLLEDRSRCPSSGSAHMASVTLQASVGGSFGSSWAFPL